MILPTQAPQTNEEPKPSRSADGAAIQQCTQAPEGDDPESVENTGISCQPCCMTKRRKAKQTAANRGSRELSTDADMSRPDASSGLPHAAQGSAFGLSTASRVYPERPLAPVDGDLDERTPSRPANLTPARVSQPSSGLGRAREPKLVRLQRLKALSRELEKLHRQEQSLLRERDRLVAQLRREGESWASLSSRTGLSRQALSKRTS
jgi:hypothetical protein